MKINITEHDGYGLLDFDYITKNTGVYRSIDSKALGFIVNVWGMLIYIDSHVIEPCEVSDWGNDRFIRTKITLELG